MNKNTGEPAFPSLQPSAECRFRHEGMTLRDYFAAKAIGTVPPQEAYNMLDNESHEEYTARRAYAMADAMLAERDK